MKKGKIELDTTRAEGRTAEDMQFAIEKLSPLLNAKPVIAAMARLKTRAVKKAEVIEALKNDPRLASYAAELLRKYAARQGTMEDVKNEETIARKMFPEYSH